MVKGLRGMNSCVNGYLLGKHGRDVGVRLDLVKLAGAGGGKVQ
jgi:hypothetical protein